MNAIVDHTFQIAAQHRTRWTIKQMGRSVEIIHLRPDAGFLRHSMDFDATDFYLNEGYRYAAQILDARRQRRRLPELPPAATLYQRFQRTKSSRLTAPRLSDGDGVSGNG
jgi:hypothetical protein